jgi:uncharacterized protein YjbI with pentapeptide repeats/membrane-associated phospholipid phosphatase
MRRSCLVFAVLLLLGTLPACSDRWAGGPLSCDPVAGADCSGVDLSGVDLSGKDLRGVIFRRADLTGADLSRANLAGAVLEYAVLDDANLRNSDLTAANLFGSRGITADFTDVILDESNLESADLRYVTGVGASAQGTNLRHTNFTGAYLRGSNFAGALLTRTGFVKADLTDSSFQNTVVGAIDLHDATLTNSDWSGAVVRKSVGGGVDSDSGFEPRVEALGAVVCDIDGCSPSADVSMASQPGTVLAVDTRKLVENQTLGALLFPMIYRENPIALARNNAYTSLAAVSAFPDRLGVVVDAPAVEAAPERVRELVGLYASTETAIAMRLVDAYNPPALVNGYRDARERLLWETTKEQPALRASVVHHAMRISREVLTIAESDGAAEQVSYEGGPGDWVPTPPGYAPPIAPGWGYAKMLVAARNTCDIPAPPKDLSNEAEQTRKLHDAATEDQKAAARFWDDERTRTSTPVGHWRAILGLAIQEKRDNTGKPVSATEMLRTFAGFDMLMFDTSILVWREKYEHRTPRPLTVIGADDPDWNSYLGNPPFPAYPSGHSAFSSAAAEYIIATVGDRQFTDPGLSTVQTGRSLLGISTRKFASYRDAAAEASMSRVWGGIHYPVDVTSGAELGRCAASS